jgi:hypothetical protein
MRYAKIDKQYYCGIDLHSRSMYICVMDKQGNILLHRNMDNNFNEFQNCLEPHSCLMSLSAWNQAAITIGFLTPVARRISNFISDMRFT